MDEGVEQEQGPLWVAYVVAVVFLLVGLFLALDRMKFLADSKHRRSIKRMIDEGKVYTVQGQVVRNYIRTNGSDKEYTLVIHYLPSTDATVGPRTIRKTFSVGSTPYRRAVERKQVSIDVLEGYPKSGQVNGEMAEHQYCFSCLRLFFTLTFNLVAFLIIIFFAEKPIGVVLYLPFLVVVMILAFRYYRSQVLEESTEDYIRRAMEGDAKYVTTSPEVEEVDP